MLNITGWRQKEPRGIGRGGGCVYWTTKSKGRSSSGEANTSTTVQDGDSDTFDYHDWTGPRYSMMGGANAILRQFIWNQA